MIKLEADVATRGEQIYRERYKAEYEKTLLGKYVVIDVGGGRSFVADEPETALHAAISALPDGRFHLIQIGAQAVFRVGFSRGNAPSGDWVFEEPGSAHRDPPHR